MVLGSSVAHPVANALPKGSFAVDTRDLPPVIRFDVWRAFWGPVVHVSAPRAGAEGFCGQPELRRLGRHVLLKFRADAAEYRRAKRRAERWPGSLDLGALSQGFGLRKLGGHWCGVLIQPENLPQLAPVFATSRAMELNSPAARILGGMLPRIAASAKEISAEDTPRLEAALSSMLTACLDGFGNAARFHTPAA